MSVRLYSKDCSGYFIYSPCVKFLIKKLSISQKTQLSEEEVKSFSARIAKNMPILEIVKFLLVKLSCESVVLVNFHFIFYFLVTFASNR